MEKPEGINFNHYEIVVPFFDQECKLSDDNLAEIPVYLGRCGKGKLHSFSKDQIINYCGRNIMSVKDFENDAIQAFQLSLIEESLKYLDKGDLHASGAVSVDEMKNPRDYTLMKIRQELQALLSENNIFGMDRFTKHVGPEDKDQQKSHMKKFAELGQLIDRIRLAEELPNYRRDLRQQWESAQTNDDGEQAEKTKIRLFE